LLPEICLLCDARAGNVPNLCGPCAETLPRLERTTGARVLAFRYEIPISSLIQRIKFEGDLAAARTLGVLLADRVAEALINGDIPRPDAIVPVPLHRARLRARGFNQSLELARPVSRRLGLPLLTEACLRVRATVPQSGLASDTERRRNVADAFRVQRRIGDLGRLAIVDDVVTSGATVRSLAGVLRRAGVRQVLVWACAGAGQASRLATESALVSMNSRRGST
jgi:ComF family protein